MRPGNLTVWATGGVLGGWLAIMPASVVTLALRVGEWQAEPSTYANILAAGWLTMLVSLIVIGRIGDVVLARTGSRALLVRFGAPLIAVSGVLLAVAPTPGWLAAAWIVAQVPAAMVITTALAACGNVVHPNQRGVTSGLIGAAPILAVFVGSFMVRLLTDSLGWAFIVPALLGAVLAVPLMRNMQVVEVQPTAVALRSLPWKAVAWVWVAFLGASFLLSWATSTTNGFIVLFIEYVTAIARADVATTATTAVILASLLAVIASVVAGSLSGGRPRAFAMWSVAAVACGLGLVVLITSPTSLSIYLIACIFGISFGVANGVELAVILQLRTAPEHLGRDLGLFTAMTTAPYVLVPALASVVMRDDTRSGLLVIFGLASISAIVAGVVIAVAVVVMRTVSAGQPRTPDLLPQ